MKYVIFYEKYSGGHREPIQKVIREYLNPSRYSFQIFKGSEKGNFLNDLLRLNKKRKINHCHLLTLDDVLFDFQDKKLLSRFLSLNISLSATSYKFYLFQLKTFFWALFGGHLGRIRKQYIIYKLLSRNIIKKIAIPDERVSFRYLYPLFFEKFVYLPDVALINKTYSKDRDSASKLLGLDPSGVNFLMFGTMHRGKGLHVLLEAVSRKYEKVYSDCRKKINIIIAGKQFEQIPYQPSRNINIIQYNKFIEEDLVDLLFTASDCVIMPYLKDLCYYSSGTFSIACSYNKFVIVPNKGILAWRVKKLKNGFLFRIENPYSLAKVIAKFSKMFDSLSYPILGSAFYAKICSPENYVKILNQIIEDCI